MRSGYLFLATIAVLTTAIGLYWAAFLYFENEEQERARGQLSLYRGSVAAELDKFAHLTYVVARDPFVMETANGASTSVLNQRLAQFAAQTGVSAIYLMAPDGETISASNHDMPSSYVGQNYGFRPYFKTALSGKQGRYYAIGATTGLPGYFIADPVRDQTGDITGVIAIKLDLDELEQNWRDAGEKVFLADQNGVVLLASEPDWRYQTLQGLTPDKRAEITRSRQFMGQGLPVLDWREAGEDRAILNGESLLHLVAQDLPDGWQLHYFADYSPAITRGLLVAGLFTILASTVLILTQFRHGRRIGAALRRSEAEEAQLREANERLAIEIEDRRRAERRLKRTQDELERAGRLAALGQLSASVTHELGQPIAAMRNHIAAAEFSADGPKRLIPRIEELVDRMEGITRQLKFFARRGQEEFGIVDLADALRAALSLVRTNIKTQGVDVSFSAPQSPVLIWGNKLRIEQVMTNILRNAVDAMEESTIRNLSIEVGHSDTISWFSVEDTGHGLGDSTLAILQEPFMTTRESGRGMGLGLAISSNIIAEHEGHISAENTSEGARFLVELPRHRPTASEKAAE